MRKEVLADGEVDIDEAKRLLVALEGIGTGTGPVDTLRMILKGTVKDGKVSAAESEMIADLLRSL